MFFNMKTRDEVVAKTPGIAFGDVGKQMGALWKALSDEDKKPYTELALKDKERYLAEKAVVDAAKAADEGSKTVEATA